jgi:hypothetical protein
VGSRRRSKQTALRALLEEIRPERVTEAIFSELRHALEPVSENYLRRLLRETGVPLAPLVEGIRQDGFEELERTLLQMQREYADSLACRDAPRAQASRRAVIAAKEHARFSMRGAKRTPEQREAKQEMILWMLTWLENPGVFPAWLGLRKKARAATQPGQEGNVTENARIGLAADKPR